MKNINKWILFVGLVAIVMTNTNCEKNILNKNEQFKVQQEAKQYSGFYSNAADEYQVQFKAVERTNYTNLNEVKKFSASQVQDLKRYYIFPTLKFLFGPLTYRSIGGEQKDSSVDVNLEDSYLKDNHVYIPYSYTGQWIVNKDVNTSQKFQIPLPYNDQVVFSKNWKTCTDTSSEEHQDTGFFWYFWEPERPGCEHKEGVEYQMIDLNFSLKTEPTTKTFPEYKNMVQLNKMNMTFAFGYVEDKPNSSPFTSNDPGMYEFRRFVSFVKDLSKSLQVKISEKPITEEKYFHAYNKSTIIGTEFSFIKDNIQYSIKVVSATEIDQMELFTVSFAKEHDAFFGWYGHSRVGNGFDAQQFNDLLRQYSSQLNITKDYQMIYWAGCNSYSYYTKPFFAFKENLIQNDVDGTKSLDIISNGLPSLFSLNALNAKVLLEALTTPNNNLSYQEIINRIELQSNQYGVSVLVNVLGDENN